MNARPERALGALALAAICVITFANVIARYFTNYSFAFTEEYSVFLMVVMTLFGSAAAIAADRHIRITFLIDRLPRRWRRPAEAFAVAAAATMFALLVWYGGRMAWDDYRFEVTSPGLGAPQWIYTAALPLLSGVILLRALGRFLRILRA